MNSGLNADVEAFHHCPVHVEATGRKFLQVLVNKVKAVLKSVGGFNS